MKSLYTVAGLLVALAVQWPAAAQQSITADRFAVASGHSAATQIGLEVLRDGGNVIDVAIATSLAVGVAEPYGSGLGGKLVMLYREAATGRVYSVVALCTSPRQMDVHRFVKLPSAQRKLGYHAVGVPGLVAGLGQAHQRWGSKSWEELVRPAAELAATGITIDATMQGLWKSHVPDLRKDSEAAQLYLYDGELPPIGARLKNADLAATLEHLAANGARSFYTGPTAHRIVAAAQAAGVSYTLEDFSQYEAELGEPLAIDYRDFRIYSCPTPLTGGSTVLAALKTFEQLPRLDAQSKPTVYADQMARTLLVLYPEIQEKLGDTATSRADAEELISQATAARVAEQASQLDPLNPYPVETEAEPAADALPASSTTHLVVADAEGNMVSLTQSLSLHFGAAVVAPETGFLLNDSMSNFSTHNPGTVNYAGPAKRARSTIAPILVTRDQRPFLSLGIPGGQRIPTTTVQLLWHVLDQELPLDRTFALSRFHLMRPVASNQPFNLIEHEIGGSESWQSELEAQGWRTKSYPRNGHYFGGGNAIQHLPSGELFGVADPRRTNAVAGD